jgi:hypothetical protein
MDESSPPPADANAGDERSRDAAGDYVHVEPDLVTHEQGVRHVIEHLLVPALARRLDSVTDGNLRCVTPLAQVLPIQPRHDRAGRPASQDPSGSNHQDHQDHQDHDYHEDHQDQNVDGEQDARTESDASEEPTDAQGPRGGVVVDLARYRSSRRTFGRRGRAIDGR